MVGVVVRILYDLAACQPRHSLPYRRCLLFRNTTWTRRKSFTEASLLAFTVRKRLFEWSGTRPGFIFHRIEIHYNPITDNLDGRLKCDHRQPKYWFYEYTFWKKIRKEWETDCLHRCCWNLKTMNSRTISVLIVVIFPTPACQSLTTDIYH